MCYVSSNSEEEKDEEITRQPSARDKYKTSSGGPAKQLLVSPAKKKSDRSTQITHYCWKIRSIES
jgi:hypothetical protein